MNAAQRAALANPTAGAPAEILARRFLTIAGDGVLITTVLAVDR